MNARERMLAAIERRSVDRIPTDIWATPEAWGKLETEFGDRRAALEALHIDGVGTLGAEYVGPSLPKVPDDEDIDYWGLRRKRISYHGGTYMELYFHPLAAAKTIDDLDAYNWPRAEWFDYTGMKERAEEVGRSQIVRCGYMAPFFYHNLLRGLEQSLVDPLLDPDLTHEIVRRISQIHHPDLRIPCTLAIALEIENPVFGLSADYDSVHCDQNCGQQQWFESHGSFHVVGDPGEIEMAPVKTKSAAAPASNPRSRYSSQPGAAASPPALTREHCRR